MLRLSDAAQESSSTRHDLMVMDAMQMHAALDTIGGHIHLVICGLLSRILKDQVQIRERLLHVGLCSSHSDMRHVALSHEGRLRPAGDAGRAEVRASTVPERLLYLVASLLLRLANRPRHASTVRQQNRSSHEQRLSTRDTATRILHPTILLLLKCYISATSRHACHSSARLLHLPSRDSTS